MTTRRRTHRPRLAAVTALALLAALALAACTSDDPRPTSTPSPSPTAEATTTPAADPTPERPVTVTTLALPEGCALFDRGWNLRIQAALPTLIELSPTSCAREALDAVVATSTGLRVEWAPLGFEAPVAAAVLLPSAATGRWQATVTFPQPGRWVSDSRLGIGYLFEVFADDFELVARSPDLPLPAAPKTVAVFDGGANEILRTFTADRGGFGLLRDPDRTVFVQTRDGDRWLVTGNIETGEIEPLFPVGLFANLVSAPDGRAVAVEWGRSDGRRELRIVTSAGAVTAIDDGAIGPPDISWAPDSSTLFVSGDSLWLLDPDGAVRLRLTPDERSRPSAVWSPDSAYLLLQYAGQGARLSRLDIASLAEQTLFADSGVSFAGFAIAPDSQSLALVWWDDRVIQLSVTALNDLPGTRIEDHIVASFQLPDGAYASFGGLSWSPDGRLLALAGTGLPIDGAAPASGSLLAVIDSATGEARRVAEASDYYFTWWQGPVWSTDASTLFALRFNCIACEPSSSAVDAIDVEQGRVLQTFERSSYLGPTIGGRAQLLSTPQGLLRTDGRGHEVVLHPSPGGAAFGPPAIQLADPSGAPLLAVQLGVGRGRQLFAARSDGSDLAELGLLAFNQPPYALLDSSTVVVRGDRYWARYHLDTGLQEPYPASSDAYEKFDFTLSPSGRLAVDRDTEGFAVLDPTAPTAAAVVAYREYPGAIAGLPLWSPDERRLAFGDDYTLAVFDIESGSDHVFPLDALGLGLARDELTDQLWALTWTPDGALLFATTAALWRLDLGTGVALKLADAPNPGGFTQGTLLAYSPDGETLVAGTQFGVFALDESDRWRQLSVLGLPVTGGSLYWSPDSSAVVVDAVSSGYYPQGIIVVPLHGAGPYRLVAPGAAVRLLGWLPDGRIAWVTTTGGI